MVFLKEELNVEKAKEYLNMVVRAGILAAAIGFVGTISGWYSAIEIIAAATEISPTVIMEGFNISLSSTILGFEIFIISGIVWFVLRLKFIMRIK